MIDKQPEKGSVSQSGAFAGCLFNFEDFMTRKELVEEMDSVSIQLDQLATAMICYGKGQGENQKAALRQHSDELQGAAEMLEEWMGGIP